LLKHKFIEAMIAEDIGRGDLFSRISTSKEVRAYIVAKSEGVFGGREYIEVLAKMYDLRLEWRVEDGTSFTMGEKLLFVSGDSKSILSLERSILDIALHASSIAIDISICQKNRALWGEAFGYTQDTTTA